jgi:UDP-N-acetylmuramyl pentapeptide phosphotransferase/UDP-N-acetylglucosamine-1-phosphate transferase
MMFVILYLICAVIAMVIAYQYLIEEAIDSYQSYPNSNIDADDVATAAGLAFVAGVMFPFALVWLAVNHVAKNEAERINIQRKQDDNLQ